MLSGVWLLVIPWWGCMRTLRHVGCTFYAQVVQRQVSGDEALQLQTFMGGRAECCILLLVQDLKLGCP